MIDVKESMLRDWSAQIGADLPELERGPISRGTLALFAGASNDHAFLHIDSDYVKAAGMADVPDVFAHGMLVMAYMGHLLTSLVRQENIRSWKVRFVSITQVHAILRCSGRVKGIVDLEGERCLVLEIFAHVDDELKLKGEAIIALK
jgi:acyl dehydratase